MNTSKNKDAHPKTFDAALKYMNDCQMMDKPGGYKKPHSKSKESGLVLDKHGGGKATGKK